MPITSGRIFSAIIRRFFDKHQLPFLHLVVLPPHFLLHVEGGAADSVAQGVVEVVEQPVFEVDSESKGNRDLVFESNLDLKKSDLLHCLVVHVLEVVANLSEFRNLLPTGSSCARSTDPVAFAQHPHCFANSLDSKIQ